MTSGGLTCGVNRGGFKFARSVEENKKERRDGQGRIVPESRSREDVGEGVWEVNKRDYARSVEGHSQGRGG